MTHLTRAQVLSEINRIEQEETSSWGALAEQQLADTQRQVMEAREEQLQPRGLFARLGQFMERAAATLLAAHQP